MSKIVYLYVKTSLSLLLPINCNDDQNYVLTHEHVTCTLDAGGDASQLTSKETRPTARYARQSAGAFADPKPRAPGRDPVRDCGGYGLP